MNEDEEFDHYEFRETYFLDSIYHVDIMYFIVSENSHKDDNTEHSNSKSSHFSNIQNGERYVPECNLLGLGDVTLSNNALSEKSQNSVHQNHDSVAPNQQLGDSDEERILEPAGQNQEEEKQDEPQEENKEDTTQIVGPRIIKPDVDARFFYQNYGNKIKSYIVNWDQFKHTHEKILIQELRSNFLFKNDFDRFKDWVKKKRFNSLTEMLEIFKIIPKAEESFFFMRLRIFILRCLEEQNIRAYINCSHQIPRDVKPKMANNYVKKSSSIVDILN